MGNSQGPTSADITRLTSTIKDFKRSLDAMVLGIRALNTNLVAIHKQMEEEENE